MVGVQVTFGLPLTPPLQKNEVERRQARLSRRHGPTVRMQCSQQGALYHRQPSRMEMSLQHAGAVER